MRVSYRCWRYIIGGIIALAPLKQDVVCALNRYFLGTNPASRRSTE
jgi:hypothetical protein